MAERLSHEQLLELVRTIKDDNYFSERNTLWDENRQLVFGEREVVIPGVTLETEFRTPELLEAADKYTARFLGAPFAISVSAQAEGSKAFAKAQALENLDYRIITRLINSGVLEGPVHDMVGVTGEGWVHVTLNRDILPIIPQPEDGEDDEAYLTRAKSILDEYSKGERTDLVQFEPVREPETIYYTPGREVVFQRAKVPLAPLQVQYNQEGAGGYYGEPGKSKQITEDEKKTGIFTVTSMDGAVHPEGSNTALYQGRGEIMLYIVEDAEYIYHLIEDAAETTTGRRGQKAFNLQPIGCYKNVFGRPGFVAVHARKTNHPAAKHQVHPLTQAAITIAPQVNLLSSIVFSGGILGELTRIQLEPLTGAEAAEERKNAKSLEIELLGQRVIKFPDGYKATQPNIGVNADTLNAFAQIEAKLVQYSFPISLGQPEESDASSGYQQAVQRDTVSSILDPVFANLATMLETFLGMKDTAIKTLNYPITFRHYAPTDEAGQMSRTVQEEITIDPGDIVEVDRQVRFDSLTQFARQAKIELGDKLLAEGRITKQMFYTDYMGVDDPARLMRQRYIEAAIEIAEGAALKTTSFLFMRVSPQVSEEAVAQSGLEPFLSMQGANPLLTAGEETDAITTTNGAGGTVPLQPAQNAQAEMGSTTEGARY